MRICCHRRCCKKGQCVTTWKRSEVYSPFNTDCSARPVKMIPSQQKGKKGHEQLLRFFPCFHYGSKNLNWSDNTGSLTFMPQSILEGAKSIAQCCQKLQCFQESESLLVHPHSHECIFSPFSRNGQASGTSSPFFPFSSLYTHIYQL